MKTATMHAVRILFATFLLLFFGAALSACSTPLLTNNPQQVNLSGRWQLVPELSDPAPQFGANNADARASNRNEGARSSSRRRDDHLGNLRPVIRARSMIIEQTGATMGINYSGFPYRDVSWGKRTRGTFEVNAGWLEDDLHIRSKRGRMVITEVYRLSSDQQQLQLIVSFRGGSQSGQSFSRVFARKP